MAAHLFEAAEARGIPRAALAGPLGLDAALLVEPGNGIEWDNLVTMLERLDELLDGDVDAMRQVGHAMANVPSFAPLHRAARAVVSLRSLFIAGERWIAPAEVPHLIVKTSFPSPDRMQFRCSIPEPYAGSVHYLNIFEGLLCATPTLLGLPPATILSSRLTARELDLVLALPASTSVFERMKRVARAALFREDTVALLEAQRREIEEGLEAAKRATAEIVTLFDHLPNLVVIHRAGKIVWANRAAVRVLGHRETTDLVDGSFAAIFHSGSRDLADRFTRGAAGDPAALETVEAILVTRDESRVLVEVSPPQSVSFGGRDARLFVAHDVTERKRLQQQLSISDRLASVGMLAAGVAHEVNNPLAYVLNNIEIARRELRPLGPPAEPSRVALTVALEGVDQIRTIIRDLLALSRVDDGDPIGAFDVVRVVETTLALATPHIEERAVCIRQLSPVPLVRGTPSRVGQVLLNLVANALEAMPPANRAANVLTVTVAPSRAGGAVMAVSDTGVGIAPEHAPHVFEPFFTTKSQGTGTGLGLAISQRLVAEMGGALTFDSTTAGTTFRLTLPPDDTSELG